MALEYGFCLGPDSTDYTSKQFSTVMRQFAGDGVGSYGGKLALSVSGFAANLAPGYVLTAGRWVENSEPLLLLLPAAGNYEDRTDAIAATVNEEERKAAIEILQDVDPQTPPDGTLYLVRVKRGSIGLTAADITDMRKYIIPLNWLSSSALWVYNYLSTGIDEDVESIIYLTKQETYRAYISYVQLKTEISARGGNPQIGDLLTSCIPPTPADQWLLCNGSDVPEQYEELSDLVSGKLPDIHNQDERFKTYMYGGMIGVVELPPVEQPILPDEPDA